MAPERLRLALLLALLASSAVLFIAPPELAMNSERMVDDPIKQRIEQESVGDAKKSMLVIDQSKFGRHAPVAGANITDIDLVICDRTPAPEFSEMLSDLKANIVFAEEAT